MQKPLNNSIPLAVFMSVVGVLWLGPIPGTGQAPAQPYRAPRFIGTQNPDLSGIWQTHNSANWDLEPHAAAPSPFPALTGAIGATPAGLGVVEGGKIPYQTWAEAKKKENFEKRFTRPITREINEATGDPEAKCYLPGVPRATYLGLPFQIVQTPTQILLTYEFAAATRVIHVARNPSSPNSSWMGGSI